jgi:undecaprenyl-diphosphatase
MDHLQAIVLGIIQGLTEYLPISSTAHLRVIPALLGWNDPGAAFTAVIQWGTLLAAVIYFRRDITVIVRAVLTDLRGRTFGSSPEARLGWVIAVGTIPIVVFGLAFQKYIKDDLRSLYVISAAAIGLALVLAVAEGLVRRRERAGWKAKGLREVGWAEGLVVGFAQVLAIIPGASRSGVTITGGLFAGLSRETAARFSFLLGLPAIFGAGLYELYKERHELLATESAVIDLVIATVVSGIVGYATIAWLLSYLKRHTTWVFIAYRVALGALLLFLLWKGLVPATAGAD